MPALATRTTLPRPTDPEIIARMVEATRKGHPLETAGRISGLGKSVAQDWYAKGVAMLDASPGTPAEELGSHAVFADAVNRAEAEMVDSRLNIIERDTQVPGKGWLPAMTLLERRRPQDFGRNQRLEVTTTATIHVTVSQYPPEVLAFVARQLLQASQPILLTEGVGVDVTDTGEGADALPTPPDATT